MNLQLRQLLIEATIAMHHITVYGVVNAAWHAERYIKKVKELKMSDGVSYPNQEELQEFIETLQEIADGKDMEVNDEQQ